ncbi:MAG: glycoside hydrolase family 18 protein [Bacteroidota bacterium]
MQKIVLFLSLFVFWGCQNQEQTTQTPDTPEHYIVGYVFGSKPIDPATVDAKRLTHINYAFADIVDNEVVGYLPHDEENYAALNSLKKINPNLKILISIGGWGKSNGFSDAALTEESRATFVASAIKYMEVNQLDGIDLDWEYPAQPGAGNIHRPEDKQNFTLILRDLRTALDKVGERDEKHYLLTIASAANERYLALTEMDKAQVYLDFINVMTYDFAGSWSDSTAHQANLYPSTTGKGSSISAAQSVDWHIAAGIPVEKLVLGVPFYGRYWTGVDSTLQGLHQTATQESGGMGYHEIMSLAEDGQHQRFWDEQAKAPYLWEPNTQKFLTYDDPETMTYKAVYIQEKGMAGAMYWQNGSDTTGTLLRALYEALEE